MLSENQFVTYYWRNIADCFALFIWRLTEYHSEVRIKILRDVLKVDKWNIFVIVIIYITGSKYMLYVLQIYRIYLFQYEMYDNSSIQMLESLQSS